eukprot:TRINITY_DN41931_c0_g1_i2.p1 TRINITY_DN41931_c0_g1~~TRINITY_DN41931_c0_g1_i2.p1  ORF type:complete len:214 (-),score=22.24 TRINITY_DN41931_c0_g1_i2:155-796(-)
MAVVHEIDDFDSYERVYQPHFIDVSAKPWEKFGYALITISTVIMVVQACGAGPIWLWERADDVMTILFTFELLMRIFEKGYLFFTDVEKNWNFFDTLVVAISLFSMVIAAKAARHQGHGKQSVEDGSGGAMKQMKVLRTLRLLRLLRVFRIFKSIDKVNLLVDMLLESVAIVFLGAIAMCALLALVSTVSVAFLAGGKAWLRTHELPRLPHID